MSIFMLMMLLHPDVQSAAQEELDRVIGRDRLPEIADRDTLPYVTAVINEIFRQDISPDAFISHKSFSEE